MAKLTINRGSLANDGTGDNLRDGANKINLNFDEIYTAIGDGSTVDGTIKIADDSSTVATISANGETLRVLGGTAITTTLSGNTLTIAADTASLITASGTATLTNKSIDLTDNTITGTLAEFNTAVSDATLVSLTGSETLTNKTINAPDNTVINISNSNLSGSAGITNANLANSSISITGDDSSAQTISLGGGILFTGGSGITTSVSGNEITFATDGSIVTETSTDTLENKTISGSDNTLSNIPNSSLTNSIITIRDDSSTTDTISLGETLIATGGTGITSTIASNELTFSIDSSVATTASISTLTNKTINGPDNTLTNIANGSLANSSVTIGDDTIALGGTQTTITNLSLDGATGTIDLTSSGNKIKFNYANTGSLPDATTYQGMFATEAATAKAFFAEGGAWNEIVTENSSIGRLSNVDITSSPPTNGQVLVFNSGNGRF